MNLKLDMDNPADRENLRRAVLDLVAGRKMPKQKPVADEIRDPAGETHWTAVSDAARSAANLFRQRVKAEMEQYDLPGAPKDGDHQRKGIWGAIDKAYALARADNRPIRWFRSTDLSHGYIRGFHHNGEILNIDGQRPHCDTTSVCLPRHPAAAYLFLGR